MIAFKYTKTDGAEYLSHLDLLRHVYRTLRRAGIEVAMSEGYHAHARIFLNNPLAVGVSSVAEYAAVDCVLNGDFKELFNAYSPSGVKCLDWREVAKNPNYANGITRCLYEAEGIAAFNPDDILNAESLIIKDLKGREIDVRPRIYAVEWVDGRLQMVLGSGNANLRPDLFCSYLCSVYGGKAQKIIKLASYGEGVF